MMVVRTDVDVHQVNLQGETRQGETSLQRESKSERVAKRTLASQLRKRMPRGGETV